ncbi:nucleoside hydrolase-like isoform X1 [Lineus longissimus]|uniref:nucleoside hydrolase-like isoform X1 n=1 Tax=Lineus longissimus TaxID=88925 RepID=UPI002B4C6041
MISTFLRNFGRIQAKITQPLVSDGFIFSRRTVRTSFVRSKSSRTVDLIMPTKRRFIIDTDCGLDDAQAILMALSQGVDVVGITTCSGNTGVDQVCKNVLRVLKLANRLEIPVFKGTSASLLRDTPACDAYHGKDGLGDVPDSEAPDSRLVKEEHAVNALVRMINQNAGEVTLVCLGPLTNIALAIQMDPSIGSKVKECHIMGGNYEAKGNITVSGEFNFRADPEAANIVLNQLGCPVTLVCWELCLKYSLSWDYYDNLVGNGSQVGHFIKTCEKNITAKMRHEQSMEMYMCADQFSMATALDNSVAMETLNCFATVELHGEFSRGQLVLDHSGMLGHKPNVDIVISINMEKFKSVLEKSIEI